MRRFVIIKNLAKISEFTVSNSHALAYTSMFIFVAVAFFGNYQMAFYWWFNNDPLLYALLDITGSLCMGDLLYRGKSLAHISYCIDRPQNTQYQIAD